MIWTSENNPKLKLKALSFNIACVLTANADAVVILL